MHERPVGMTITNTHEVDSVEQLRLPKLSLQCSEAEVALEERMMRSRCSQFSSDQIDVTFRYQTPVNAHDPQGVLAISNNVTGDFILEVETPATTIQDFVGATCRWGDVTGRASTFQVRLECEDEEVASFEKRVFLVYNSDGTLLRHCSLIPIEIEI